MRCLQTTGTWTRWVAASLLAACCAHVDAAPPLPDFVVETVTLTPSTPTSGVPVAVSATVRNQGSAPGDGRYLDIWLNWTKDAAPLTGDVGDLWCPVGRLEPGESRIVTPLPQFLQSAGTNRLCARVDFENLTSESVDTNNCLCVEYTAEPLSSLLRPVYRFWSPTYRGHFFTISEVEKNGIITNLSRDWRFEGTAYLAFPETVWASVPLHRFWSDRYRGHFFTISEQERAQIAVNLAHDWHYEGVAYYVYAEPTPGAAPVYRFWSPRYRHHFFTISEEEKQHLIERLSADWSYEGIAFYAISSDPP